MLTPIRSGAFKRDVRLAEKRGKDMAKLRAVLLLLVSEETLPAQYNDHALTGNWITYRDAHIEPDWLLIYKVTGSELFLARTGTHSDLF